ncbi:cytochrome P450 [Streptomyces albiaxialis]|uniref:Cytochrome P450 n=1 Tax=Streptomyces albiaxialis TaxID=329523 RepID=A0ABN2WWX2_9ACTN
MAVEHASHRFSPAAPELVEDPFGGSPVWMLTRHDDVTAMLGDRRFVTNSRSLSGGSDFYAEMLVQLGIDETVLPYLTGNLVHVDPEDHTRLRRLVTRAFTPRRIAKLRPRVQGITDELVDALPARAERGAVDLVEHFAYPLSITVICELLGVPVQDRPLWRAWSEDIASMDPKRMNSMLADVSAYVDDLARERRARPADDLVTGLVQARDEDSGRLSDTELITMVLTLMVAGHETTAHLIGNGITALLTHRDQLELLRANPELMPGAVQEILRWCSPIVLTQLRFATEEVTIGGARIRRGEQVQAVLSAANHDPGRYPDPDVLDITRRVDSSGHPHLAYSHGAYYCLGASLANQEAEAAFSTLFGRYPGLALAVPEGELAWRPQPHARQLIRLPVTLSSIPERSAV